MVQFFSPLKIIYGTNNFQKYFFLLVNTIGGKNILKNIVFSPCKNQFWNFLKQ